MCFSAKAHRACCNRVVPPREPAVGPPKFIGLKNTGFGPSYFLLSLNGWVTPGVTVNRLSDGSREATRHCWPFSDCPSTALPWAWVTPQRAPNHPCGQGLALEVWSPGGNKGSPLLSSLTLRGSHTQRGGAQAPDIYRWKGEKKKRWGKGQHGTTQGENDGEQGSWRAQARALQVYCSGKPAGVFSETNH